MGFLRMSGEVDGAVARRLERSSSSSVRGIRMSKVILVTCCLMVGASVRARVIGHETMCIFAAMLRTTTGVLSDSNALAPSFDPEETHAEFA